MFQEGPIKSLLSPSMSCCLTAILAAPAVIAVIQARSACLMFAKTFSRDPFTFSQSDGHGRCSVDVEMDYADFMQSRSIGATVR